jgi:hypothetical protein
VFLILPFFFLATTLTYTRLTALTHPVVPVRLSRDPIFAGRGSNRLSQVFELKIAGFDFHVAPELWLCHPAEKFRWRDRDHEDHLRNMRTFAKWKRQKKRLHSKQYVRKKREDKYADFAHKCE